MEAETTPSFAAAIPTGFSTMGGLFRNPTVNQCRDEGVLI